MIEFEGWWLPDGENHMQEHLKDGQGYQYAKQMIAMLAPRKYDLAIDVGAHIGTWSRTMTEIFKRVIAFEPVPAFVECLALNAPEAEIIQKAVSKREGEIGLTTPPGNTGAAYVDENGLMTPCITIDSLGLAPDFIKIDVEGWELNVIKGATQTILKHWPAICVECKRGPERYGLKQTAAADYLVALGYDYTVDVSEDWVFKKVGHVNH